jgi:hypothetical protein
LIRTKNHDARRRLRPFRQRAGTDPHGINIDDRTAVESALSDTAGYTHDPAVFARYVDEVIKTARRYMATGQTD